MGLYTKHYKSNVIS